MGLSASLGFATMELGTGVSTGVPYGNGSYETLNPDGTGTTGTTYYSGTSGTSSGVYDTGNGPIPYEVGNDASTAANAQVNPAYSTAPTPSQSEFNQAQADYFMNGSGGSQQTSNDIDPESPPNSSSFSPAAPEVQYSVSDPAANAALGQTSTDLGEGVSPLPGTSSQAPSFSTNASQFEDDASGMATPLQTQELDPEALGISATGQSDVLAPNQTGTPSSSPDGMSYQNTQSDTIDTSGAASDNPFDASSDEYSSSSDYPTYGEGSYGGGSYGGGSYGGRLVRGWLVRGWLVRRRVLRRRVLRRRIGRIRSDCPRPVPGMVSASLKRRRRTRSSI